MISLDWYRAAAPLCATHYPTGGARACCVVCSLLSLTAALSKIDYLCGEENEMGVSLYDVEPDEHAVVERVRAALARLMAT